MRLLLTILLAVPLYAHDFWIEPSTFRPAVGETVRLTLMVGEHFRGQPVVRRASRIESFTIRDEDGEEMVSGFEGRDPAGVVVIDGTGVSVVGYRGRATPHQLSAAKFEQYLREEGLDALPVTPDTAQREHFYRFAKSLLRTGSGDAVPAPLGYRLELHPLTAPFASGPLALQLTLERRPLPGALVTAMQRSTGKKLTARTDAEGRVTLAIGEGVWLVKSTHVLRSDAADRDWDSLWASLTLER
jgi:uncharacterized GH25 family protein